MSGFTPELGQAAFSNGGWQHREMPYYVEAGLHAIASAIAGVRGDEGELTSNWGERPWESDTFAMRTYCWCDGDQEGHEDGCPPNFEHRASGLIACWYKHAGRSASINQRVSRTEWTAILVDCLRDVMPAPDSPTARDGEAGR